MVTTHYIFKRINTSLFSFLSSLLPNSILLEFFFTRASLSISLISWGQRTFRFHNGAVKLNSDIDLTNTEQNSLLQRETGRSLKVATKICVSLRYWKHSRCVRKDEWTGQQPLELRVFPSAGKQTERVLLLFWSNSGGKRKTLTLKKLMDSLVSPKCHVTFTLSIAKGATLESFCTTIRFH